MTDLHTMANIARELDQPQPKERPMLFQDAMVRAILSGQKVQTRRLVKPFQVPTKSDDGGWFATVQRHPRWGFGVSGDTEQECAAKLVEFGGCPYGKPGDRLWVREAWRTTGDGGRCNDIPPRDLQPHQVWYEADGAAPADECVGKYRPPMFMPRWACRLVLEIVSVRVERLQDISRGDAMAEGCPFPNLNGKEVGRTDPVGWYRDLWESINGAESWGANPWVWVVESRRARP